MPFLTESGMVHISLHCKHKTRLIGTRGRHGAVLGRLRLYSDKIEQLGARSGLRPRGW